MSFQNLMRRELKEQRRFLAFLRSHYRTLPEYREVIARRLWWINELTELLSTKKRGEGS